MRKMKDSGVPWIGEIPRNWTTARIKNFSTLVTGKTPPTTVSSFFDGDVTWFTPGDFGTNLRISESERTLTDLAIDMNSAVKIPKNTVLVIGIGGTAGKVALATVSCSCNQQITAITKLRGFFYGFLLYSLFAASEYLKQSAMYTTLPIINNQTLGEFSLPFPEVIDQQRIAEFLDAKTAEVDSLQSQLERQIEVLETYKRSVITETVTRGLDPAVQMKDSGIPWISEIPAHWEEKPIRVLFSEVRQKNVSLRETESLKFTYGQIVPKCGFYPEDDGYIQKTIMNYTVVKPGVIIINGLNLNFDFVTRRVGLVCDAGIITSAYIAIDPIRNWVSPKFACYSLKSWDFHKAFHNMGGGVRKILNFSELGHEYFTLPPLAEQQRIATYLDEKVSAVDEVISLKQEQLTKLADYKKSLIFEYVTGKKEVLA